MKVSHNWTRKGEAWQRIKGQWWLIQIVLLQAKVSICCYGKTWMNFLASPISQRHDVEFKKQKYVNEGNWVLGMWSKSFTYINPMFTSFHLPLVNWFRNPAGLTVSWYSKCLIIIQNNRGKVLPGFPLLNWLLISPLIITTFLMYTLFPVTLGFISGLFVLFQWSSCLFLTFHYFNSTVLW